MITQRVLFIHMIAYIQTNIQMWRVLSGITASSASSFTLSAALNESRNSFDSAKWLDDASSHFWRAFKIQA